MLRPSDGPGVFIQRDDRARIGVAQVRTDIAGFAGIAEAGPLGAAVRVRTMRQFETAFGSYTGAGFLAYALRAFFENGGRECLVARVASDDSETGAACASVTIAGVPGLTIRAASEGRWGNGLEVLLAPSWRAETLARTPPPAGSALAVDATEGFAAGSLVRLSQVGKPDSYGILALADAAVGKLYFVHPQPERRRPTDRPLADLDPTQPVRIERLVLGLSVRRNRLPLAVYPALGLVAGEPDFIGDVLRPHPPDDAGRYEVVPPPVVVEVGAIPADTVPLPPAPAGWLTLAGGRDGLAGLAAADFLRALALLEAQRDVSILAAPDLVVAPIERTYLAFDPPAPDPCAPCPLPVAPAVPSAPAQPELPTPLSDEAVHQVQAAMVEQCERLRDRIALIDPPLAAARSQAVGTGPVLAWRQRFDSAFAALTFPWLDVVDPLGIAPLRAVPPSGHVAGQLAFTDLVTGPHKAAANRPLAWAEAPSVAVPPAAHGLLNEEGINVIIARSGRPARLLGARSLSSDPDWRFLPVRRLISMLRRALDAASQWAVFEPNDETTRTLLQQSIGAFLESLRRGGALAGDRASQAWRVRCDETNNPASARARGELVVDIAVAPARPLEFILLRLGRSEAGFELAEQGRIAVAQAGAA
jgi:uncharacterized protein